MKNKYENKAAIQTSQFKNDMQESSISNYDMNQGVKKNSISQVYDTGHVEYEKGHKIFKKPSSKMIDGYIIDKEKTYYITNLRLYRDMEEPLKELAKRKSVSINELIIDIIDKAIKES